VGKNVLAWTDAEKRRITSALDGVKKELEALSLPLPKKILMVKTTGREEGGAVYTRANAIVFPGRKIMRPVPETQELICHELFHIVSRSNPAFRERLYAVIGFVKCNEVAFPSVLKARKITNPDAPRNDHCIRLQVTGKDRWAIPILLSSTEKYNVARGGEFFEYLEAWFLLVERDEKSSTVRPLYDGKEPSLVKMHSEHVAGFSEQIGENTTYDIHPEEILADNFAFLVLRRRDLPSPAVIKRLERVLKENRRVDAD
jgi:hypothetical protein